jgi:predicted glycosyltransferase
MSDPLTTSESKTEPIRVLFDLAHPAHVHLFRNAIAELERRGHRTFVASREKDVTTQLLDAYDIPHRPISEIGEGPLGLAREWLGREARLYRLAREFDPDVIVGVSSPTAVHVSKLLGCRSVVFHDSEVTKFLELFALPYADSICTPANFSHDIDGPHRRYDGYQELAYLHPNWFEPDSELLREYGVEPDDPYSVLRFISWGAHHDVGHSGLSLETKERLVDALSKHGDVYITSESPLPPAFEPYRLPVPPEAIHHLLWYADLYVGDSQTMATEAALLGTPAVRSNSFAGPDDMSNFRELETEYGLLRSVAGGDEALSVALDLLTDPESKRRWAERRDRLLAEKIDVTDYIVETILEAGGKAPIAA